MAAGIATNEVMVRANVPARAAARGKQLRAGLDELGRRYGWIGDVRGMGLMQALEIVEDEKSKAPNPKKAKALLEAAKDQGLLIGLGGLNGHVIRLGPSLLVTEEETADALGRMSRACAIVDRSEM
jgi:4-aminobutyrate aminotransferase-like enzyme